MNSFTQLVQQVRSADWSGANKTFAEVMQQKVADRLATERQTIFKESTPKSIKESAGVSKDCSKCGEPEFADKGWDTKDGFICRACYAGKPRQAGAYPKVVKEAADDWGVAVKKQDDSKKWGVYINGKLKEAVDTVTVRPFGIKRQDGSKIYGVYVNGKLREGGFSDKDVADEVADDIRVDIRDGGTFASRAKMKDK